MRRAKTWSRMPLQGPGCAPKLAGMSTTPAPPLSSWRRCAIEHGEGKQAEHQKISTNSGANSGTTSSKTSNVSNSSRQNQQQQQGRRAAKNQQQQKRQKQKQKKATSAAATRTATAAETATRTRTTAAVAPPAADVVLQGDNRHDACG